MAASRTQLKESLAASQENLRYLTDMIGYLDQFQPAAVIAARNYAESMAQRRRTRKAHTELETPVEPKNVTDHPTREEIETAARVCEQLGHRVTALALRNRLERSDA